MMIESKTSTPFETLETFENPKTLENPRKLSKPSKLPGIIILLSILLAIAGCKENAASVPDYSAAYAAKEYYDSLFLRNNHAYFVDGRYQADSIPPQYRRNLIMAARQFVAEMNELNGPIDSITVVSCYPDTALSCMQTQLRLNFRSGETETILVPMQMTDRGWKMR